MIICIEQTELLSFVSELLVTTGSLLQSVWFQGAVYRSPPATDINIQCA